MRASPATSTARTKKSRCCAISSRAGVSALRRRPITTESIGSAATHPSLRGALATKQSRGHNMRGASNPDGRAAAPGLLRFAPHDGQGNGSLVSARSSVDGITEKRITEMGDELHGKVAAVTGAASGIGLACATTFLKSGAKVVLIDRAEEKLKHLCADLGPSAIPLVIDLADPSSVAGMMPQILERAGGLDI